MEKNKPEPKKNYELRFKTSKDVIGSVNKLLIDNPEYQKYKRTAFYELIFLKGLSIFFEETKLKN